MALSTYKFTQGELAGSDVASLPDQPSAAGITAAELKARFDLIPKMLIALGKFNELIDALTASGGADVGASVPGMSGATVEALLGELKGLSDQLNAALGAHKGDGSNPHRVTKAQVGLGLADINADMDNTTSRGQGAVNATVGQALSDRYTKAQADGLLALKADKIAANLHLKEVAFDPKSGVFTFTRENGAAFTIDTLIEKIPLDVQLIGSKLVLTLSDGTTQEADLSAFIDTYTFQDSDTLAFSAAGKVISAIIKDGSVTLGKMSPETQATLRDYTTRAEAAAASAQEAKGMAEASRDGAKSAAETATAEANAASTSAAEAQASQKAAAQSAANLAQAAAVATAKAEEAASSAVAAKGSEEKAKASETLVQAAADAAKASETASKASETAAAGSANSARDSKDAAKASENNAAASAQTAAAKAGEASSSAIAAANSAQGIGEAEERAAASAALSTDQAALAKSYAVGGTGSRPGEDTDNAKYYKDQAAAIVGGDYATKLDVSTAKREAIAAASSDAAEKAASAESNAKAASIPLAQKGAASGVATLDAAGKVPSSQLPPMDYDPAGSAQAVADSLAAVATTGSYNDLKDKPAPFDPSTLARVATTGSYNDLKDKPAPFDPSTLARVATTGAYGDLTGRPGNATSAADGLMTKADKAKLDGVEAGANNYTHPASHPASMITGLGGAATKNVGTAAGTVAAGDHTHTGYINKAGDTMTGALKVPSPTAAEDVANKAYVDSKISPVTIPIATDTVAGRVKGGGLISVDAAGNMDIVGDADGVTWEKSSFSSFTKAPDDVTTLHYICYGKNLFVSAGSPGSTIDPKFLGKMFYSFDAKEWHNGQKVTAPGKIAYGNGRFVMVSDSTSYYSDDGINWIENPITISTGPWSDITYGDGKFVACNSAENTGNFIYSYNGIVWFLGAAEANQIKCIAYSQPLHMFVAYTPTGNANFLYSYDGIAWNYCSYENSNMSISGITWGDDKFVAVGKKSTSNAPFIATSIDGKNWVNNEFNTGYA